MFFSWLCVSGEFPGEWQLPDTIQQLLLGSNCIAGINCVPVNCQFLQVLDLSANQLSGALAPSFHALTGLVELNLSGNALSDVAALRNLGIRRLDVVACGWLMSRVS